MDLKSKGNIMKNFIYIPFLITILLLSCVNEEKPLELIKVAEFSSSKVTDTSLARILYKNNGLKVNVRYTLSEDEALKQLEDKKADLVIIPNNAKSGENNFRTLVPLLPRVLMILTNKKLDSMSIKDLFEKGHVYFEDRSRLDRIIFRKLYYNFDIDESKIQTNLIEELIINKKSKDLEVYVGLTHINNLEVKKLTNLGWHFFSLDNIENYRKGSRIEGFTMMNSSGYPFVIPMSLYKGKPKKSILTYAINDILICRADLDEGIAYNITQTIIENKSHLSEMNPVYNLLNFDYDSQVLSFPKHKGTKKFLDRNEPPVWSKYVKMIWPLISISVVLFGIMASLRQRLKRRKKQNIEMYYNTLLEIRGKADEAVDVDSLVTLLKELKLLRSEAMKSLANKKLDSGESFNIFLALFNDTKTELIDDIKEIRLKKDKNKT
jgi:TRAP-type uncharacterized transport system substrate-binding protein